MHTAIRVLDLPLKRKKEREKERALTDPEGRVMKVATPSINPFSH